ncbi:MAG: SMI1/KNR4 family protein [Chloroflexota bacterium]|nr:SMI1/KNR4 family protein [Chloroflexota bacterium]
MNESIKRLIGSLALRPGASRELVRKVEAELGISLPKDYLDFMVQSNGAEGPIGKREYLVLWAIEKIIPLNEGYQVKEFAPGLLLFGGNGGGEAYAFDTRFNPIPIVRVPFIGLSLKEAILCGQTFIEFLENLAK